jgi:hypothetical protein
VEAQGGRPARTASARRKLSSSYRHASSGTSFADLLMKTPGDSLTSD